MASIYIIVKRIAWKAANIATDRPETFGSLGIAFNAIDSTNQGQLPPHFAPASIIEAI
jgi:hypothetical protein